jgi:hypothetical protein
MRIEFQCKNMKGENTLCVCVCVCVWVCSRTPAYDLHAPAPRHEGAWECVGVEILYILDLRTELIRVISFTFDSTLLILRGNFDAKQFRCIVKKKNKNQHDNNRYCT